MNFVVASAKTDLPYIYVLGLVFEVVYSDGPTHNTYCRTLKVRQQTETGAHRHTDRQTEKERERERERDEDKERNAAKHTEPWN